MWSPLARLLGKEPSLDWYTQGVPEFTPDMAQLCTRPFQRIFIPDEMMSGKFRNELLGEESSKRLWAITADKFSVWRRQLGKASTIVPLESKFTGMEYCGIRGELWKVPSVQFAELDKYKKNGVEFLRKRVFLAIPYEGSNKNITHGRKGPYVSTQIKRSVDYSLDAWMYIGIPEFWNKSLIQGSKINYYKNGEKITGRLLDDGSVYVPVNTYKARNELLEKYYYYSAADIINDG